MAKNKTFTLECPCCGAALEIDAATGKILFSEESKKKQEFSFDGQLDRIRRQKEESEQRFSKVFQDEADRKKLLERKFEEARKKAQEDKSEARPRNPLDFD